MISHSHHGQFAGSNRIWFMPGTDAHVSDGTLVVAADRVSVRWAHDGAPKEGELVLRGHVEGSTVLLYGRTVAPARGSRRMPRTNTRHAV